MSQDLAPPPRGPVKSKNRRRLAPWLSDKPETRSVQIGVLGTVLIHLLLLLFAPRMFKASRAHAAPPKHVNRVFNIELAPPPKPPPPARARMKYVEANPNAPENTPDKTDNVSDRNQQVAQEKPALKNKSDMPTQEGRKDIPQQQIVTGNLEKPQENVPTPPPTPPKAALAQTPRKEENPLAGIDKSQGASPDGFATNIGKNPDNQQLIPQRIDGVKEGPQMSNFSAGLPQIDPKHPQPRREVEIHVRPAVFAENKFGSANVGVTALDSRWSNYGVYMKRLTEAVQIQWDKILDESAIYQASGNSVSVTFILNSKGGITSILKVDNTDGTSDAAKQACVAGVSLPAPYGPWTDDMIAMLGTQQVLTFTFYYQ
jgi:hypothetical protein